MSMLNMTNDKITELLNLIEQNYPGWQGFSDPRFEKDEIIYKQGAVDVANELLTKTRLENFLKNEDFVGFKETLMKVAQAGKNLLFLSVPKQGDMGILMVDNIDKLRFMKEFINLLYGEGDSPVRLERFSSYTKESNLPNKWTFSTYFLFVCNPESEMYVKPHTTTAYLDYFGKKELWTTRPSGETYRAILDIAAELKRGLSSFIPRDMVDIQGFLWVLVYTLKHPKENPKKEEFLKLFSEFKKDYFSQKVGQEHLAFYARSRQEAIDEYPRILEMQSKGQDITDQVLLKLLPYNNTAGNREREAWVHVAPSIIKDIKDWYEGAKWTKPEDWPRISEAILDFISKCLDYPENLTSTCKEFSELPYSKGFQSGMLTPILNALNPEEFILFNNKSCKLFNYFLDTNYTTSLSYYHEFNEKAKIFIEEVREYLPLEADSAALPGDFLDMFSHWLVAVKKYFKPKGLAEPFSKMFKNIDQAELGFNLLESILNKIYNKTTNEEIVSVTFRPFFNGYMIRINLGNWLIFGLNGKPNGIFSYHFLQPTEKIGDYTADVGKFTQKENEFQMSLAEFIKSDYEGNTDAIHLNFDEALNFALTRFSSWGSSPYRRAHNSQIETAILDLDYRQEVLEKGLGADPLIDNTPGIEVAIESPPKNNCFDEETFFLLGLLDKNPFAAVYHENKDKFKAKVEEPLQKLLTQSLEFLNEEILEILETEKGVYSRILKNDYGRGGAWPFYWGVFYPKGSHKNSSNRLDTCITSNHLRFGTGFGFDSNQAKIRFDKNCRENLPVVTDIIKNIFANGEYHLFKDGETKFDNDGIADIKSQSFTWQEWLNDPEMSKYSVTKVLPKKMVIQMSFDELVREVSDVFNQLFPIILLAFEDDPMPTIYDYLEITPTNPLQPEYPIKAVANNTGFQESELRRWVKAIHRKGQAIIYGPPGTGKTYIAEKIARHLIGGGDGFYELVQFHPEVSYEDFIQGIRPEPLTAGGLHYPVVPGRFLKFCDKASSRNDTCVLIIDEINRANLARVFGELMYLLEYRYNSINLSAGTSFSIPKNVRIIGTMNTADRSIALVDHALRRRFAFLALYPDFEILRKYHQREQTGTPVAGLIDVLKNLNDEIQDKHYMIGTSYFLRRDLEMQIEDIWRMEIEPYLEEFFFDQPDKYKKFTWANVSSRIL